MKKAVVLVVKFDWKDIKNVKNFGELYEEIGLKELISESAENPDKTGGEIVKANIYATSYVMAKIASIFSSNMLREYVKELKIEHEGSIDKDADFLAIMEHVCQHEYAIGFEAGVIGPELTDFSTPTLEVIAENEDNVTESDPVIYVFQEGTEEHVKPHKGGAAKFLRMIKAMSEAVKEADMEVKILKKEK